MKSTLKKRILTSCSAFLVALATGHAAYADDSEIFLGNSSAGVAPNILFILDTSGSMASNVTTRDPYDPSVVYGGTCDKNYIYFQASSSSTIPKGCGSVSSFKATLLNCVSTENSLTTGPGFYADQFVQWHLKSSKYFWDKNSIAGTSGRYEVACQSDFPAEKPPNGFPTTYNGATNKPSNEWVTDPNATNSYWKGGGTGVGYTLYSANYLNYQGSVPTVVIGTRMSVVKQAATDLINSLSNANVGLMRYSNNGGSGDLAAQGGMVAYPVLPVSTNRTQLTNTIKAFTADGYTPLSETLYESYLYLSGGTMKFGNNSVPFKSVAASRVGGSGTKYLSPIQYSCQKNFIVYLTDGLPTQDNQADPDIKALAGACDDTNASPYNGLDSKGNPIPGGWGPGATAGQCMAALAGYMNSTDLSSLPKPQNAQLFTIGFGDDPALAAASTWLSTAASAGHGKFYAASDLDGLQTVLTKIVNDIKKTSVTFTAPTVSVNAFNRTQTLNDLYVSLFQPSVSYHWPGNVKRYHVTDGKIVDKSGADAVDSATGTFKGSAQSFWSDSIDGADVTAGGAASHIPDWNPTRAPTRNLYTYVGTNTPSAPVDLSSSASYKVVTANSTITNAMLGVATNTARDNAIAYARGEDLRDEVGGGSSTIGNGIIDEPRHAMGDPLHSQPAVVIYGGTAAAKDANDAVVFTATNDGYLHAFNVTDGSELWAYIPQELLSDLPQIYANNPASPKNYSLDGSIKALKFDVNGDGVVDGAAGDKVILFFGQGRGGSNYYAVDVTDKKAPKFMWSIGPGTTGLSAIGQAWSTPTFSRVNISGATQNSQKIVLIFGGGYDSAEEATTYQAADSSGNAIYMVDALKGTVLWHASKTGADLNLVRMDHSIPSDVTVLDLDGDGYADRMYVGDMAAQLWKFDIHNGNPVKTVVAGGVIASLGAHDDATSPAPSGQAQNTRRFYSAPDVAAVSKKGINPFFNISIGSGYRGHPLDTAVHDRFYAIRDYLMFDKFDQNYYDNTAPKPIEDNSTTTTTGLIDVTTFNTSTKMFPTVPATALGWYIQLNQPSWAGEKVLSSASTFNDQILFTSYIPNTTVSTDPCLPGLGTNRLYVVSAFDGTPVSDFAGQNNQSATDRYTTLSQTGIAPQVTFLFPETETTPPDGGGGTDPGGGTKPPDKNPPLKQPVVCMSGAEVLGVCKDFNSRVKTYWSEKNAN
jgi:type IV pilus assembly protein PilY1